MKAVVPVNVTDFKEIRLSHPRTGERTIFLISDGALYEPHVYSQEIASFFVGDSVDPDSSVTFITRVDELFLIFPVLLKHQKQFRSLSDIIPSEDDISHLNFGSCLPLITDVKVIEEVNYYRYSKEKVTEWLKTKILAISKVVLSKKINFSSTSSGLVALRKKNVSLEDGELKRYSFRLVADYLPEETAKEYLELLGLKERELEEINLGASDVIPDEVGSKKDDKPTEDYYKSPGKGERNQEKKVLTRAQKSLAKVDKSGMKSINSYFSKSKV